MQRCRLSGLACFKSACSPIHKSLETTASSSCLRPCLFLWFLCFMPSWTETLKGTSRNKILSSLTTACGHARRMAVKAAKNSSTPRPRLPSICKCRIRPTRAYSNHRTEPNENRRNTNTQKSGHRCTYKGNSENGDIHHDSIMGELRCGCGGSGMKGAHGMVLCFGCALFQIFRELLCRCRLQIVSLLFGAMQFCRVWTPVAKLSQEAKGQSWLGQPFVLWVCCLLCVLRGVCYVSHSLGGLHTPPKRFQCLFPSCGVAFCDGAQAPFSARNAQEPSNLGVPLHD